MRLGVLAHLASAVSCDAGEPPPTQQKALGLLLRGRSPYDTQPGAVCLAPFIEDLLPGDALSFLEGFQERMLASDDGAPKVKEFMDPMLRFNVKRCTPLIRELHSQGLTTVLDREEERFGVFAVWKVKNKSQRLIVDARRANARFRRPPRVELISAEALARVEVEIPEAIRGCPEREREWLESTQVYAGAADVKVWFHRMCGCPATSRCCRSRPAF